MRQWLTDAPVRVQVRPWPDLARVQTIVVLDHHVAPTPAQVEAWVDRLLADHPDTVAVRTSALYPPAAAAFAEADFHLADDLALLERPLRRPGRSPATPARADAAPGAPTASAEHTAPAAAVDGRRIALRRLRRGDLAAAATVDRRSFPAGWSNDEHSLGDIRAATPQQRSRVITVGGDLAAFAITGRAGAVGYLQRLAVDPAHRRLGLARRLVDDSTRWLARRGATSVLVNTGVANDAALALYRSTGFRRRPDGLAVMERRFVR